MPAIRKKSQNLWGQVSASKGVEHIRWGTYMYRDERKADRLKHRELWQRRVNNRGRLRIQRGGTHGMADRRSLTVRSGMTTCAWSTTVVTPSFERVFMMDERKKDAGGRNQEGRLFERKERSVTRPVRWSEERENPTFDFMGFSGTAGTTNDNSITASCTPDCSGT